MPTDVVKVEFLDLGPVKAIRLGDGTLWIQAVTVDNAAPIPPAKPRQLRSWRTIKELTEELRFPTEGACRSWLQRQGIVSVRRGRVILVDGLDVDRVLRKV